MSEVCGKQ